MSSTSTSFSLRAAPSAPGADARSSISPAPKSAASGTENPANATSRSQLPPRYESAPEEARPVSWNGERPPSTETAARGTRCFPPSTFRSVVFPAPLAPRSRQRDPAGRERCMSTTTGGTPGSGRPSGGGWRFFFLREGRGKRRVRVSDRQG